MCSITLTFYNPKRRHRFAAKLSPVGGGVKSLCEAGLSLEKPGLFGDSLY